MEVKQPSLFSVNTHLLHWSGTCRPQRYTFFHHFHCKQQTQIHFAILIQFVYWSALSHFSNWYIMVPISSHFICIAIVWQLLYGIPMSHSICAQTKQIIWYIVHAVNERKPNKPHHMTTRIVVFHISFFFISFALFSLCLSLSVYYYYSILLLLLHHSQPLSTSGLSISCLTAYIF